QDRLSEGARHSTEAPTLVSLRLGADEPFHASSAAQLLAEAGESHEPAPLSMGQQRLWFLAQLDHATMRDALLVGFRLDGPLDRTALAASVTAVVSRHDGLRAVFWQSGGEPVQHVLPSAPVPLPLTDLSAVPPAHQEAALQELLDQLAGWAVSLAEGPLVRV